MEGFAGKVPADFVDGEIYPPIAPAWLRARMGSQKEPGSFYYGTTQHMGRRTSL